MVIPLKGTPKIWVHLLNGAPFYIKKYLYGPN